MILDKFVRRIGRGQNKIGRRLCSNLANIDSVFYPYKSEKIITSQALGLESGTVPNSILNSTPL